MAESYPLIEAEHPYLQWDQGYTTSMMDFWSEYTEYGMAICEDSEGSAFEQAMFMRYIDTNGLPRDESVELYARYPDEYFELGEYPRYWNGIVIFYKLLLLFFTIPDIRMINMFLQISLLIIVIYLMTKKNMERYIVHFATTILFINPVTMLMSVKYAAEYVPMLLSIIVILLFGEKIQKVDGGFNTFFAISGCITSFFCMLSFPAIVLGIPLFFLVWINEEKNITRTVVEKSFFWTIGYGVTWALKWIICTLFTSYNLLENAFNQMSYYEGEQAENASIIERLMHNLWAYYLPTYLLLFLVAIILIAEITCILLKKSADVYKNTSTTNNKKGICDKLFGYFLLACIPVVMIIVLGNGYAYKHYFMAHRNLSIAVMAGLCFVHVIVDETLKRKLTSKSMI